MKNKRKKEIKRAAKKENKIKVSIVMPSLNVQEYIEECIKSVISQTLKDIQIICVDAGSTDGTLEIIQEYAKKDSRIEVVISDKRSYGYQMNLGFSLAKGKYVGIVETDDYVHLEMYERLYNAAEKSGAEIVKANFSRFIGEGKKRTFTKEKIASKSSFYNRKINPQEEPQILMEAFYTWAGIYNRAFIEKNHICHNETPGASYQDNGFYFQTFCCAKKLYLISDNLYRLRRDNPNSSMKSVAKVFCVCDEYNFMYEFLKKDEERYQRFLAAYWVNKHRAYWSTLKRIAQEYKLIFLKRYYEDFSAALLKDEMDLSYLNKYDLGRYRKIMTDYEGYFYAEIFDEKQLQSHQNEMEKSEYYYSLYKYYEKKVQQYKRQSERLLESKEYKIGSRVLYLPRKIKGGVQCILDHGVIYTIKYAFQKIKMGVRGEQA